MKFFLGLILFVIFLPIAFAQTSSQVLPTEKGTLDVDFSTIPDEPEPNQEVKLSINFINPFTNDIQMHIDYRVTVSKDGEKIFETKSLLHTSKGSIKIPIQTQNEGIYDATIQVEGILFQPIPPETVSFNFSVGDVKTSNGSALEIISIPNWIKNNAGWWAAGQIDDDSFVQGIQFLIKQRIMTIPETQQGVGSSSDEIPDWIKNNAGWWAAGQISDNDFIQGIQWLIENGIMRIS